MHHGYNFHGSQQYIIRLCSIAFQTVHSRYPAGSSPYVPTIDAETSKLHREDDVWGVFWELKLNQSSNVVFVMLYCLSYINTLRPRQNGRHFADDIFKWIFMNKNVWIPIEISLKFVPKGPINNIPALVQVMAWRRAGDKPLSEPMMSSLLTHICVTRPQWVILYWTMIYQEYSNLALTSPFMDHSVNTNTDYWRNHGLTEKHISVGKGLSWASCKIEKRCPSDIVSQSMM